MEMRSTRMNARFSSGDDVNIGDEQTESITIGDASTGHLSIASSVVEVGTSATTLTVGNKASSVKIGDVKSTIELYGACNQTAERTVTIPKR